MKTETTINDLKGNLTEEEMASVQGGFLLIGVVDSALQSSVLLPGAPIDTTMIEDEETPL